MRRHATWFKLPSLVCASLLMVVTAACGTTPVGSPPASSQRERATTERPVASDSLTLEPAPQFGLVLDKEMRVIDVEEGGAAEKAGVQVGDVLTELNGEALAPLDSLPQVDAAFELAAERTMRRGAAPASLAVRRNGAATRIEIMPGPPPDRRGQPTPTAVPEDEQYI